jgi:Flagellar hook-length control protein FliK
MKITDLQPGDDPDRTRQSVDSSQDADRDKPSAFAKVLTRKQQGSQDEPAKAAKGSSDDPGATGTLLPTPATSDSLIEAREVEVKHVVALPPELQQLVREVALVVNTAGQQQVHIELNSNVLSGLHIRVDRKDGTLAIQFLSSSDEVAKLLSQNLGALSEGLADRGLRVTDIGVAGPKESGRLRDDKNRPSMGAYGQRGRQGGRR